MIRDTAGRGGQFVIATHSPILLACPGATILHIEDGTITRIDYDDVPNVQLMRDFLRDPGAFLRHL